MNMPPPDAPPHPQLMDPATDPESLIASSVYWYPLLFPTRTEVLDHLLLTNGNGYEWGADGNIRSVFSHIEPDYDRLDHYEAEARKYEAEARGESNESVRDLHLEWAARERAHHAELLVIRDGYRSLARTYGPVRMTAYHGSREARTISTHELSWTLLGEALGLQNQVRASITGPPPARIAPAWQRVVDETRLLFADVMTEQGQLW